jgi:hypothetical protein
MSAAMMPSKLPFLAAAALAVSPLFADAGAARESLIAHCKRKP